MELETAEQTMLRDAVRRLAAGYGHAYYLDVARNGGKATELWEDLARAGYLGIAIPTEYGGGGGGITELAIVCEELAAVGTPSFLLIVSQSICAPLIARFGSDEHKQDWLPRMAAGEARMAFSITEPDAGLNTWNLSTTAVRHRDGYRLNGAKYYASCADEADAIVVVARTGTDAATGRGQLSLFLVETGVPGLSMQHIPVEITAPEKQFTLFFDQVRVPADRLIGAEHDGLRQVFSGLNPERITGAAQACGLGRYALDKAAAYAVERRVWDVPIGAHQGVSHPLAVAKIELELARLMTLKAAWLYDTAGDPGEAANMAKYAAAEASLRALDQAIQTHGGNGMATEYGLADLWGLTRLLRTAPVSREMVLNFVAQHSLGLPKSY
jgi:alkylation response protein AidB-like acyl-CoA dehydrogenase